MFTTSTHWYAGAATALIGTKLTGYPTTIKQLEPFMIFAFAQGAGRTFASLDRRDGMQGTSERAS